MEKIIITGKNGYLANNLSNYLKNNNMQNECVSVRTSLPDFKGCTTVVHTAGIVHVKEKKEKYCEINHMLTVKLAKKAKKQGVEQFIFFSTMSVYGVRDSFNSSNITEKTIPKPNNFYGMSKLAAEKDLKALESEDFRVAIVRLPVIYGKHSPGNFSKLYKLAEKLPFFPYAENHRSMLFIDNMCEFVRLLIVNRDRGVFCPQERDYINTSKIFGDIRKSIGKKVIYSKFLGKAIVILNNPYLNKIFSNLTYDKAMSAYYNYDYCITSYESSIRMLKKRGGKNDGE